MLYLLFGLSLTLLLKTSAGFLPSPTQTASTTLRNQSRRSIRLPHAVLHNEAATTEGDTTTIEIDRSPEAIHSNRLNLPLRKPWSTELRFALDSALTNIAASTDFFEDVRRASFGGAGMTASEWLWQCRVPAFGKECHVILQLQNDADQSKLPSLLLSLEGSDDRNGFAWVSKKLWEKGDALELAGLDCCESLRQVVIQLCNELPPDPGLHAATEQWTAQQERQFEDLLETTSCGGVKRLSKTLDEKGFAVIETPSLAYASRATHDKLSEYLVETTSQGEAVRTDQVHFMNSMQAFDCGIGPQYDLLMGIAHYLNIHPKDNGPMNTFLDPHQQPISPATATWPLTVPPLIQFAEYGRDDYYKAHSDNSLTKELTPTGDRIRSNFRAWTCILYLNNDWNISSDGGALRLYPSSQELVVPGDAKRQGHESMDVNPTGLLIFDSTLVHSVEPVLTSKVRRALTLWINRPNNSGVRGETFY